MPVLLFPLLVEDIDWTVLLLFELFMMAPLIVAIYILLDNLKPVMAAAGSCPRCRNMAEIKMLNSGTPYGNSLPMTEWQAQEIIMEMRREEMAREQRAEASGTAFQILQWMFIWRAIFNMGKRR